MSFWVLRKKLVLECVKFAIYIAVPIGLALVIAFPVVRQSVLVNRQLPYPATDAERPITREELSKLQVYCSAGLLFTLLS
jgi:hypothetical protein